MREMTEIEGVPIWRPLLRVPKSELEAWLASRNLSFISDSSNSDPKYLRARMRTQIIPYLSQMFGKNISGNLAALSDRAREINDYLACRCQNLLGKIVEGPFGIRVDGKDIHRIELRYLVQQAAARAAITLPRPVLESILDWIEEGTARRQIACCHRQIVIDRSQFVIQAKE